jgi:4-amino-4-deoxy-L-arabinose transferase-like glycosyltransferase
LFSSVQKRWALLLVGAAALYFLYFFGLTRTGLVGPDEPRYAAIGRAMAESGDWVTPRLWGEPWFEKPALLYWMTAAGFETGLDLDLAPRLPVAIASVAFLIYFFVVLRREFGDLAAFYATTVLATSAGWLAYSHVAVTDLPMSAAFAAAMLAVMSGRSRILAGVFLGAAVLAKGLVPLALFLPALWYWRKRVSDVLVLLAVAFLVAAPWYVLVTLRNGAPFLEDFFWKQHFARYLTGALQHERPFWFYVPVLLAGFFPWTPLLWFLFQKQIYREARATFLLVWLAWGFLFFSISRNKLPGYLLPLLPAAAALIGIAIAETKPRSIKMVCLLGACAALLTLTPMIGEVLPPALASGLSRLSMFVVSVSSNWVYPVLLTGFVCAFLEWKGRREWAIGAIALLTTIAVVRLVSDVYPTLDREASARARWRSSANSITCVSNENRSLRYGMSYYAGRSLPDCN